MIKIQVIGRVGKDAIINNVNGKNVINFTVAHSEKYKDSQGEQKEITTWADCAFWTERTAVAEYIKKGGQVYVEGSPSVRTFNKQDGTTGASLVIKVSRVELLGSPKQQDNPQPDNSNPVNQDMGVSEDLPF